ncbi:MAG TPA: hypothetical protein VMG08_02215 [Allosphingosinicella sp.]|nr:hypothetical protein [Allosphingosinicella sp.]
MRANLGGSCILSLSTEGTLSLSGDATVLGSEQAGGLPAIMAVVAIGGTPQVSFTAPTLDAPAGMPAGAQVAIRYTSLGGANQAYTSAASSSTNVRLLDTFTVHGRVTSPSGFQSGNYLVATVATCQQ